MDRVRIPHNYASNTHTLTADLKADVLIIGGTFLGLSTALHLARAGKKAILLDAEHIGHDIASPNIGLVTSGVWNDPAPPLARDHTHNATNSLTAGPAKVFSLIKHYNIDCDAQRSGALYCTSNLAEFHQSHAHSLACDTAMEQSSAILDAQDTYNLTGSPYFQAAVQDDTAGTLQPLSYARGLAKAAMQEGAQIYTYSHVCALSKTGAIWCAHTAQGHVAAPWVVIATQDDDRTLCPESRSTSAPLSCFHITTSPLPPELLCQILPQKQGIWCGLQAPMSFRLDRNGRLIWGGVRKADGCTSPRSLSHWARQILARIYPALQHITFEAEQHEHKPQCLNTPPRHHRINETMIYSSGVHNDDIATETLLGDIIAQEIHGIMGANVIA